MSTPASFPPFTSFDGQVLHDADFRNAEFKTKVTFRNTQFTGRADFSGAAFNGVGDFTGAQFRGDADFSGAAFNEPLRFDRIRFAGATNFSGVHFNHDAHFSETDFAGDSDFSNATFHAWGLFNRGVFKAGMTFEGAQFRGSANFAEVDFATDARFERSRFIAFADFGGAKFRGKALFNNASVECKTIFRDAVFSREASFTDCRFTHPVDFSRADFAAAADFDRVIFLQFVDFASARLRDAFVLAPPAGSEGLAPEIRFESVTLDDPEKVRFQNISFERITLIGTKLRGVSFENPKWPRRGLLKITKRAVIYDEIQKEKPDPRKLAQLYRDIRANLEKAGTTADLGDLFYSEMEVRRKQRSFLSPYTLLWLTCGYGRRPWRAVITIGLAALAYWRIAGN